jgi:DNA-binding CsgD family transcriptional regulator
MNQTKTLLINNIALTYKNEDLALLSKEEIKKYIRSAVFFEELLQFNKTGIFVIEYRTWSYLFCSSNLKEITGYDAADALKYGPTFTLSHVHTDDLAVQEKAHRMSVEIFNKLHPDEKGKYKFAFTFKHNNPDGREITILQTSIFLKWDERGRPLVKLILASDISAYKENRDVVFFVSRLNPDGKNELLLQKNLTSRADCVLSSREIGIVELIAAGHSNKTIAERLGISVHTVKNHRKTILKKLGCKNSAQVITLAMLYGFLRSKTSSDN